MSKFVKYDLRVVQPTEATGLVKRIYRQMNEENAGIHGPFLIHSIVPGLLAGVWALFRETQIASRVPRVDLETIALVIAEQNQCPWCIEAHRTALQNTTKKEALVQWTREVQHSGGSSLKNPPFEPEFQTEYLAAVLLWNYINRMTNALLIDSAWVSFGQFKQPYLRLMGWVFKKFVLTKPNISGKSLVFLEPHDLPKQLEFAHQTSHFATAFSHMHHTLYTTIDTALPLDVQNFCLKKIKEWSGEKMGLSRNWVNKMVEDLTTEHQVSAKLILLTAFAAYQIDSQVISDYREYYPDDTSLVTALSWASFQTSLQTVSWL